MPDLPLPLAIEPMQKVWMLHQSENAPHNRKMPHRKMDIGFTIITRTANRPNFFRHCRESVLAQTHKNYFHLVVTDDPADKYPEGDFVALVERREGRGHNLYFNEVARYIPVSHPFVIFLDDDDCFTTADALARIAANIETDDDMVLWQVQFPQGLIPGSSLGLPPQAGNITGIGFCYHAKHWRNWQPTSFGDYFIINELYHALHPVWLDEVLTGLQSVPGLGLRVDLA